MSTVILAGAQRFEPTIGAALAELGVRGTIALVTAGWQERESEDEELVVHLAEHVGGGTVNLNLHARAEAVFAADPELREAHYTRQRTLRHKQDFYRIRLENELNADHVIRQRNAPDELLTEEANVSLQAIRILDEYHLGECARIHREFEAEHRFLDNPHIARERAEIAEALAGASTIAIAGGHVASLLNRLRLFGIAELLDHTVVAWSAGAMAIASRVVLFHDDPPQGPGASEVLDRGLGLVRGVVPLPQPETRLRLDDPERVGLLASRFAPALCVALPARSTVLIQDGAVKRVAGPQVLARDGSVHALRVGPIPVEER